jgi:CHAT domain-containing protein
LPGALKEVEAVKAAFAGPATKSSTRRNVLGLTGRDANEQALQRMNRAGRLRQFRFLHFAAHGYLNSAMPMLSSVVLSQTDVTEDADGYVTAAEWVGYEIDSDLIVLSACETGRGQELGGEGIMGLPYAMFVAGNRQAVLTLWRVVDDSAARFAGRFFERIAAGNDPLLALALTKREFMKDPKRRDPVHWAPFVLYGY